MHTDLDIVSSVIVAAFTKQTMRDRLVDVDLVEYGIGILKNV